MKSVLQTVTDWPTTFNFPHCNSSSSYSLSCFQGLRPRGPFRSQFRNPEALVMAVLCSFSCRLIIQTACTFLDLPILRIT